jgi:hypothetical protein
VKSATEMQKILNEVCFDRSLEVRSAVMRYFSPDYQQVTDGHVSDRESFIRHIEALRARLTQGEIEVLDFVRSGDSFAERHQARVTKTDGSRAQLEIYLFGKLDPQGQILAAHELTRVISGGHGDDQLGRVEK